MLKKTITYVDYNGEERTEDFYFNLTAAEITEMELGVSGGLSGYLEKISQTKNVPELIKVFKTLIEKSYGVKSNDGRRFVKNKEVLEDFTQTEAYSQLFMELSTDSKAAAKFVNGIVPKEAADAMSKDPKMIAVLNS